MNIFVLHHKPRKAARYLVDKHVVKMILESTQLLCIAFVVLAPQDVVERLKEQGTFYKSDGPHKKHPCAIWAGQNWRNFCWLLRLAYSIGDEYTKRYKKIHKSTKVLDALLQATWDLCGKYDRQTPDDFALAMPEDIRGNLSKASPDVAVQKYREYYKTKLAMPWAKYNKGGEAPPFS